MASFELAKKLARRRVGEKVFEAAAGQSSADAVADYVGGVRMEGGSEAVFESVAASSGADAAYCREEAGPLTNSSKAFAAALEKIRAFERERAQDLQKSRRGSGPSTGTSRGISGQQRGGSAGATGREGAAAKEEVAERERQVDFKSAVRERFAALVREGLAPNEAAARAIREAAGQQGDTEGASCGDGSGGPHGAQKSCASSAQASEVEGTRGNQNAVPVVA